MYIKLDISIYTIIRHKSVDVRKFQVAILAQSFREMSLTDRIIPRYILSRVRVSVRPRIFLYAKKPQTTVARIPIYAQRKDVVEVGAECRDPSSKPVRGNNICFTFIVCD